MVHRVTGVAQRCDNIVRRPTKQIDAIEGHGDWVGWIGWVG
ncbi:hypothetical protein FHX75_12870 [Micromonospora palomenae]|uniref:Uncharacterized protein n=1 Tax=Micromonospora palomenae TaxID=1461247 RepID=A0A561WER1_9ACTN|nr:hypothetical protein FHX75_12870 [Micromonospora palomenae]